MKKYILGCTGHIDLSRIKNFDERAVRDDVRSYIADLCKAYAVELYSGLAFGADSLFAEEALSCGAKLHVVLPCAAEEFAAEQPDGGALFNKLIKRADSIVIAENKANRYVGVSKRVIDSCDELLALWNGQELPLTDERGNAINRGGTYHTILLAEQAGKTVKIFN
ncbi:MAG: hypothetical protein K2M47_00390 [Clostridiales bacterium]|nr:hypothetical protein [Clostridiales bacterium]